jgi:hypothetical protein
LATLPRLLLLLVITTTTTAAIITIITTVRQVLARGDDDAAGRGSPGSDTKVPQHPRRVTVLARCVSSFVQIVYEPQLQLLLLHDWTIEQSFLNSPFTGKSSSRIIMFIVVVVVAADATAALAHLVCSGPP